MKMKFSWSEVSGVFPFRAFILEVMFVALALMAAKLENGTWLLVSIAMLQAVWVLILEWLLGFQRLAIRELYNKAKGGAE